MSHDHDHDHAPATGFPWGLLLALVSSVAICWLGVTGRLNLYIHPRYNTFTIVMAGLAVAATVAAWVARGRRGGGSGRSWAAMAAAAAMVVALLIVPPSTLTASSAQQRSSGSGSETDSTRLAGADPASFRIRDWADLVVNPDSAAKYAGQQVKLTGFVAPADKRSDMFYLAKFVVTCCTVDARPAVVPVSKPDWAKSYKADQWLEVTGRMMPVEDAPGGAVLVIRPTGIRSVPAPEIPYEY
ncbi:TIGR03943 family putative permease subunit [Micropruina sp.]|uniref:TIGR03943 family putative permease subunit n=1 Tax=Micropruina sp. TaxID=2737536 RepID=UPI0039E451BD